MFISPQCAHFATVDNEGVRRTGRCAKTVSHSVNRHLYLVIHKISNNSRIGVSIVVFFFCFFFAAIACWVILFIVYCILWSSSGNFSLSATGNPKQKLN